MNKVIQEAINALNDEGYPHLAEELEKLWNELRTDNPDKSDKD